MQHHILEDYNSHFHCCINLKLHVTVFCLGNDLVHNYCKIKAFPAAEVGSMVLWVMERFRYKKVCVL
jgi:hypothetical protein